jgi:hypothetical protein
MQKGTQSKLVIHKDFAGQWATEKDKEYFRTVPSGASITVYLSIIDLGESATARIY